MNRASTIPAVRFREIGKWFPGTVALEKVSFDVMPGTCHAVMGENGAGKSTLGKILAGIYRPDEGHFEVDGIIRHFDSPWKAQQAGVGIVHQELSLCPNLSVAENIWLSRLPRRGLRIDWRTLYERAQKLLEEIGAGCNVEDELGGLTAGQTQMVQIAAALATGARILIMDEPTSSLSIAEARRLEELIFSLKKRGTTFLYVSHRLEETFRICDTVTVLRDGRHVATKPLAQTNENELIQSMIGRVWERFVPNHAQRGPGHERLRVERISSPGKFQEISFAVRSGEVLGVAGLMGSGRSEVALGIFGLDPNMLGRVYVDGIEVAIHSPSEAMSLGIGLVSEDRKGQGLVLGMSCGENITLASLDRLSRFGVIRLGKERSMVTNYLRKLRVRTASADAPAQVLSGGNQQKLVLAKWLARECRILILDEPTRGIDVAAKAEFHRLIDELAAAGFAILMISSELPELLNLSTRVLVVRHGRKVGILDRAEATEERLMQLMAGSSRAESPTSQLAEAKN